MGRRRSPPQEWQDCGVLGDTLAHTRCGVFGVATGSAKHHTFWETLALLLSFMTWNEKIQKEDDVLVVGDNTASLQNILELKGEGPLLAIAREVAW